MVPSYMGPESGPLCKRARVWKANQLSTVVNFDISREISLVPVSLLNEIAQSISTFTHKITS